MRIPRIVARPPRILGSKVILSNIESTPSGENPPPIVALPAACRPAGASPRIPAASHHMDKWRLSLAEYLRRWEAKRPEVLGWRDPRLMQYPASGAATWETTFLQLTEGERRLLEILSWLAPEPIPLVLSE